jgi:uncharacterized damage-inducible protein DinB
LGRVYDLPPAAGHNLQIGLLMTMLDDCTRNWRYEELGWVKDEAIVWQPFPNGHSIGGLLLHIAWVEHFWLHEIACGYQAPAEERELFMTDQTDMDAVKWPTPPNKPLKWYFDQHDRIRARTRELMAGLTDPEQFFDWRDNKVSLRWLIYHVITHEAYHGGQIVLLALQWRAQNPSTPGYR